MMNVEAEGLKATGNADAGDSGEHILVMIQPERRGLSHDDEISGGVVQFYLTRIYDSWNHLTLSEISGSLGDMGTFIPLYVALCRQGALHPTSALFFAGLCNLMTGIAWNLPIPVQPMKAIAAAALVEGLSQKQVTTAGLWMGIFLFLLGFTNAIEIINRVVPRPVVWGMQLGVGVNLAIKGLSMVSNLSWAGEIDCIALAITSALLCAFLLTEFIEGGGDHDDSSSSKKNHPVGVYIFLLGSIIAVVQLWLEDDKDAPATVASNESVVVWALRDVTWNDWKIGLLHGALPQLPLSTLNSVVSVCCLADSLFPDRRSSEDAVLSRKQVCLSVGIMNALVLFGAMPNCHGAGGLAGQYKFGARYGSSIVFLGFCKLVLAVFFGKYILSFLEHIPSAILGVMLVISGQELASTGLSSLFTPGVRPRPGSLGDGTPPSEMEITLVTALIIIGLKKTHIGALTGIILHAIHSARQSIAQSSLFPGHSSDQYDSVQPGEGII